VGAGGGGGGGGSNYTGTATSTTVTDGYQSGNGQVTISYALPASALAAQLVTDADHLAPGTALADKAAAIQTAVNSGATSTACADITNFLGLVKAQTGKKLSPANAALLTTDANNLATALGC
jgi:hypothetical protein